MPVVTTHALNGEPLIRMKAAALVSVVFVLALTTACQRRESQITPDTSQITPPTSIAAELEAIVSGQRIPPDLLVTYDDMHGLWGGTTISVRGDGQSERRERAQGEPEARVTERSVTRDHLLDLIRLLVELRAWEQRSPERQPVPDESTATLSIRIGGQMSSIWEWVNEMPANARLSRIRDRMLAGFR
jgi:hypothetical protein